MKTGKSSGKTITSQGHPHQERKGFKAARLGGRSDTCVWFDRFGLETSGESLLTGRVRGFGGLGPQNYTYDKFPDLEFKTMGELGALRMS